MPAARTTPEKLALSGASQADRLQDAASYSGARAEVMAVIRAAEGDAMGRESVLGYLGAENPTLRGIMIGALHDACHPLAWRLMLGLVSCQTWCDPLALLEIHSGRGPECHPPPLPEYAHDRAPAGARRANPAAVQAWGAIVTAFVTDHSELEREIKTALLHQTLALSGAALQKASGGLSRARMSVRSASAYLLARRGEKVVLPVLEEILDSAPPAWKLRAVEGLSALSDPLCGPPLVKAMASKERLLHQAAWRALGELGELGQSALLDALQHGDQHVRWHAARGLGQVGNPWGVDVLAEGLLDESVEVRWATAHALANLDMAAMPAILKMLTLHPVNEPLRQVALHALHSMQSGKAQQTAKPVIDALRGRMFSVLTPLEARRTLQSISL